MKQQTNKLKSKCISEKGHKTKNFVMRVFPNTTVNFPKHLEHTRKKKTEWGSDRAPHNHNERKNISRRAYRPICIDILMYKFADIISRNIAMVSGPTLDQTWLCGPHNC